MHNCYVSSGHEYKNGIYEGECLNDVPHGKGRWTGNDGSVFEGNWINGEFTGKGLFKKSTGEIKTGFFINKIFKGKIEIIDENNRSLTLDQYDPKKEYFVHITNGNTNYRGKWYNGMKNGEGEETYLDNPPRRGFFLNDRYIGKVYRMDEYGRYCDESGVPNSLKLINGRFSGRVHIEYPNGDVYEGMWDNGYREGYGRYYYSNGNQYSGSWKQNVMNDSRAVFVCKDQYQYVGGFKDNLIDGRGKIDFFHLSMKFNGEFRKGV